MDSAALQRFDQRAEIAVAGKQYNLVDMLGKLHRIDRELDIHVALDLAAAAGVDEFLGRLGDDRVTANDNTIYSFVWLDTRKGPLVVEIPPKILGLIDDFWYRWVADVGITGADKGKGGKYLVLPPGYKGAVPNGYFVVRPSTYGNWMPFRSFLVDGSPKPGVDSVKKTLKIYPLSDAAKPPAMKFVNASGIPSNFVFPNDDSFWTLLNTVVQEEPSEGSDPTTLGLFASIGIVKGKPFTPDERMKKILADAAKIGAVTARTIAFKIRGEEAYFYPNSAWRLPFFGGYKFEAAPGVNNLDGAAFFYYIATGVTPAMAMKRTRLV